MILSSCGTAVRSAKIAVVKPIRKPTLFVEVFPCSKDQVCPPYGAVVMNMPNFRNLQENIINTESYIKQLENLLETLSK